MRTKSCMVASRVVIALVAGILTDVAPGQTGPTVAASAVPSASAPTHPSSSASLPPLPEGVEELKFSEVFAPVGARGLEYSAKAKSLDGRRVRILGYMVKTCRHDHGRFLLTPIPITLHDHEMGPADDLPPSTLFVDVPPLRRALKFVPWEPGLFLLTGTLRLGGRDELHGRRSWVRLELERPEAAVATGAAERVVAGTDSTAAPATTRHDSTRAVPAPTPPRPATDTPAAPASPVLPPSPRPTPQAPNQR